jgi:hypothetical protein
MISWMCFAVQAQRIQLIVEWQRLSVGFQAPDHRTACRSNCPLTAAVSRVIAFEARIINGSSTVLAGGSQD